MGGFEVQDNNIRIDRQVTKLDQFVLDIVKIIEGHAKYVIISGYVGIFFGRARATEDVDMFIEEISFEKFKSLYNELIEKVYELTVDDAQELYDYYLKDGISINIWKDNFPLLRMEVKFALKKTQKLVLDSRMQVYLNENQLYFANIESQIAYKKYILKSPKDLEDAYHLELVFPKLNKEKIIYYKQLFEAEFYG